MTFQKQFPITDGPSKFDLMVSIFDGKHVEFEVEYSEGSSPRGEKTVSIKATLSKVELEDGSRESWIISGLEQGSPLLRTVNMSGNKGRNPGGRTKFVGYFDTRTRKGWIREAEFISV